MQRPVVRIKGRFKEQVAFFLVEHRGVLSLIDTGTAGSAKRALDAIAKAGHKPEDVRQIVLTHCHGDHTGEAKRLHDATGATVISGAEDVGPIEGTEPYPGPPGRISGRVFANLAKFQRVPVDYGVSDREHLEGGLVAIPAPGHTAGHIAVQAPDLDTIFVGDLVWHPGRRPQRGVDPGDRRARHREDRGRARVADHRRPAEGPREEGSHEVADRR
jgi:glyoxylase-like metal-dependent hydrolase (beta-lactamase superfamily II)